MFNSPIYIRSPQRVQEALISVRARIRRFIREGRVFHAYSARAQERERWPDERLSNYQFEKLRALLQYVAASVPYYEDLFNRLEFRPELFDLPKSIGKLPFLSKMEIIDAGDRLIAKGRRKAGIKGSTSGTTGTPVTIYQDLQAINRENAFIARQLCWAGYIRGDANVWLRGDMIVPADQEKPPYWRFNRAENMLMMSSYHLAEGTAKAYLGAMAELAPTLIQAYPSSIGFLARYLQATNRFYQSDKLRSIVTSSESLTDEDRRLVEARFGCRVFDWYGAFERVAAIGTCEAGNYHLMTDYSFVEFDSAGDGLHEIIGTGFNNFLMPLIRFRTGDLVEFPATRIHCQCGRAFPVIAAIHGRQDDYIKLPDGRQIGRMDHIFKGLTGIAEAQVVQDELDIVRILVVPFDNLSDQDRRALSENARQRLGGSIRVQIDVLSNIPRTSNGKFRSVICNV